MPGATCRASTAPRNTPLTPPHGPATRVTRGAPIAALPGAPPPHPIGSITARAASREPNHRPPPPTPLSLPLRCSHPASHAALTPLARPGRRRPPRQAAAAASHVHTRSHRQPQRVLAALRRRRHAARRLAARGQRRLCALVLRARRTLQGQGVGRVCLCRRRRPDARGDRALVACTALRAGGGAHAPAVRAAGRAGVAHAPVQPHLCSV